MLDELARGWMEAMAGEVEKTEPLAGGISSEAYAINLARGGRLVLRLHTNAERVAKEPGIAAREAYSLQLAAAMDIPAPRLIAVDLDGSHAGVPTVLMTHLPGSPQLDRPPTDSQLGQVAQLAAAIHEAAAEEHPYQYSTYVDLENTEPPAWSETPATWERAIELARQPPPATDQVFVHRDFHPGNILWQDDQLTGIVDWVDAGRGPADVDAGHCRLNMVQLWGATTSDAFAAAYQTATGALDPHWDLVSFLEVLGDDFQVPGPRQAKRLDEHVARLVESQT